MEMTLESFLAERNLTWRDFCSEPYQVLSECRLNGCLYSTTKGGHFLFNQEDIVHVLLNGVGYPKIVPHDWDQQSEIRDFFAKWIFYREDDSRSPLKKALLRAFSLSEYGSLLPADVSGVSLDNLYIDLRYAAFSLIIDNFFLLEAAVRRQYFAHSEAIFSVLQGGRAESYRDIIAHTRAFEGLYREPKRFDFDEEFFHSAVLNSVIDGYEPLLDIIWNTVKISVNGLGLDSDTAYAIALGTVPSFRYVVRHAQPQSRLPSGIEVEGKLFCFLSEKAINRSLAISGPSHFPFGRGLHMCAGRGLVDEVVPATVTQVIQILRHNGVVSIDLVKAFGLGAEGIVDVRFVRSVTAPKRQKSAGVRRNRL
jgi:hypothetical protein